MTVGGIDHVIIRTSGLGCRRPPFDIPGARFHAGDETVVRVSRAGGFCGERGPHARASTARRGTFGALRSAGSVSPARPDATSGNRDED